MSSTIPEPVRAEVIVHCRYRCSYCQSQEDVVGMVFTIDHIIPQALGGTDDLDNLCLACWDCNRLKKSFITGYDQLTNQQTALFHPNRHTWSEHFVWDENGLFIRRLTPIGRTTIFRLQLNRPVLLRGRTRWIQVGWHPPED